MEKARVARELLYRAFQERTKGPVVKG